MKDPLLSSSFKYRQQDPDYKGETLDEDYTDGPVNERPCTDVLCCIIFLVFLGGMVYVAVLGFRTGDPSLLAAPFDQAKNQCGVDKGYQNFKFIFISSIVSPSLQSSQQIGFICVSSCPTSPNQPLQCQANHLRPNCSSFFVYPTQPVVNICLPTINVPFDFQQFNLSVLQQYFSDLRDGRYLVLGMFGVALVIGLGYSLLMRWFAGCFLWAFILLFIAVLVIVGAVSLLMPDVQFLRELLNYDSLPNNLKNRDYQIACGCLCLGSALIITLVVCCMRRQIRISIGIIKASSDFVRQCLRSLLLPIFISLFQMLFIAFWIVVMLYIFSSNSDMQPIDKTPFTMIVWDDNTQKLTIFYVFGLVWIVLFFEGMGMYWSSSVVAIWYFEEGNPSNPIVRTIRRSFKNFGSIAFGSGLLAVVTVLRVVLELLNTKAKNATMGMNDAQAAAMKIIIKCAACMIACFERLVRFLTQNAYIMMSITGKNFCMSSQQSFYLILRNCGQFAISQGTIKLFMNLGKSFIVTVCTVLGYIFLTSFSPFKQQIYEPIFLTIIFAVASYPIASAFMSLFQMAANTLLVCYCIQLDAGKGKSKCPHSLKNFIQEYIQSSSLMNDMEG